MDFTDLQTITNQLFDLYQTRPNLTKETIEAMHLYHCDQYDGESEYSESEYSESEYSESEYSPIEHDSLNVSRDHNGNTVFNIVDKDFCNEKNFMVDHYRETPNNDQVWYNMSDYRKKFQLDMELESYFKEHQTNDWLESLTIDTT